MARFNRVALPAQAAHNHLDLVTCIRCDWQLGQLLRPTLEDLFGRGLPDRTLISHARSLSRWVWMVCRNVSMGMVSLPGTRAAPSNGASKRRAWTSALWARVGSPFCTYARASAN